MALLTLQIPQTSVFGADVLEARALARHLEQEEGWLALLHYRTRSLGTGHISDADDAAFFLARNGRENPSAELVATLRAFQRASPVGDEHPLCRFPARAHWLEQRLGLRWPQQSCPAFLTWRDKQKARAVSLIFPTAYLNSPSSMFGHTFFRLDPAGQTADNVLLAATVNYAAETADDNELFYAFRGLFGGYPGRISVLPYYEKVKEYRDWENRDIWEYRLNLLPEEVAQLIRHVWELYPIRFDYFFIDENCSYRLLALLDVARPGLGLRHHFRSRAIPADVVRAVVAAGLVRETTYRPSAATTLKHHLKQLTAEQRQVARRWADGVEPDSVFTHWSPVQRAGMLESAYEFSRYRAVEDKQPREVGAATSYRLLRERSRIAGGSGLSPPPPPAVRDDQGHLPRALGVAGGVMDDHVFGEVNFRSAYHGLTDPWPGYRAGAQINFLDGRLRYDDTGSFRLERFDVLDIRSVSPRDEFFKPWSWSIALGARRTWLHGERPLLGYLSGDSGLAGEIAGGLAYVLWGVQFETGTALDAGMQLAAGPRLGWLYRGLGGQGLLSMDFDCRLIEAAGCGGRLGLEHVVNLDRNLALSFRVSRERIEGRDLDELRVGIRRFF